MNLGDRLWEAVDALLRESFDGPSGDGSWYVDSRPGSGLLGVLDGISSSRASIPPGPGRATIAAHVAHVRFAIELLNRALRGEDPYPAADWKDSWRLQVVGEEAWAQLRDSVRREYLSLRQALAQQGWLEGGTTLTEVLAAIAHTAYHLGAIRQILGSLPGSGS